MNEKILVMDDEPLVLATIERSLSKVGYQVTAVADKGGFTEALSRDKFDLFITDLHMKHIKSNELIAKIRESNPDIRILIMSGSVPEEPSRYFLQKPFRIDDLRQRVRDLLDELR